MEAVIIQHLLSTELAHIENELARKMENELARKSEPSGPAIHLLQAHTHAAHMQAQAGCTHLEATVQAARCDHAAADTAVCTALQLAQQELREQQELLSASRQELLRSQEAAHHRATLLPPAAIAPGMVGRDGGSPSAGSTACSVEEHADPQALAAVARALCEALEPEAEEREAALAPAAAAAAAAPNGYQRAPDGAPEGEAPTSDGSVPLWSELETATPLETAQALSEVLAWRSLQMQIGHVADAVSCLQCVPLGSGPAAAGCDATWHAQTAGASARPGTRADFAQSTGAVSAGPDVIRRLRRLNCGAPPPPPRPCRPRHRTSSHPPTRPPTAHGPPTTRAWPQLPSAAFRLRQLCHCARARTASWAHLKPRNPLAAAATLAGHGQRLQTAPGPRPTRCPLPLGGRRSEWGWKWRCPRHT